MKWEQKTFNSIDYDNDAKKALKARNEWAKMKRKIGYKVVCSSLGNQLITTGGIGSDKPRRDVWTKSYMATIY